MRLRRSDPDAPGIRRVRRGRGFSYSADGETVRDEQTLDRIRALVVPPAWREVWISPHPNGHIQAVGLDVAGRRQYLYHEQWRRDRDEEKFDRVLALAARLPDLRDRLRSDLERSGLGRRRVEALAIGLLDRGAFRIGGEEYAEENGTRGVATLLRDQVEFDGEQMVFDYIAKGGARRRVRIRDPLLIRAVRSLRRIRSESSRLLLYRCEGAYREVHAEDVNARFRDLAGIECSAKDLRTWHGTVLAAAGLGSRELPDSARARTHVEKEVVAEVADGLGNTPSVARASYIDPRVLRAFDRGDTIASALHRAARADSEDERRAVVERSVIRLLRRADRP
ncbi:DNA topoisomerase IB [Nocardia takedensis]